MVFGLRGHDLYKDTFLFLSLCLGSDRYTGFRLGLGVWKLSALQLFTSRAVFLTLDVCNALYACLSVLLRGGASTYTAIPAISNELYLQRGTIEMFVDH